MSKINPRNYQARLAFEDADLRKPEHDQIMLWLSDWVKNIDNVRQFIAAKKIPRQIRHTHKWDAKARETIKALVPNDGNLRSIAMSFDHQFPTNQIDTAQVWPNEPPSKIRFVRSQWELPLKDRSTVGYCDLYAEYEVTTRLEKIHASYYSATPYETRSYSSHLHFKFELSGTAEEWDQYPGTMQLFFEVKTEIRSVGELMRQLQLYRNTETGRGYWTHWIVVAPPHNEAALVCADHGISFLQYRPS